MTDVSIHRALGLLWSAAMLLSACGSGKLEANASVDGKGANASANHDDGNKQWDGDDETGDDDASEDASAKRGRRVEDHAWQSTGGARATLPGFRVFRDGTSRVFVEVSGHVPVAEAASPGLVSYRFKDVKVPERVNMLDLPTLYFDTPVTLVQMKQIDGDAELLIHLRRDVKPKVHLKRSDAGTVLSVDFPKYNAQQDAQVSGEAKPAGLPQPAPSRDSGSDRAYDGEE
jgi:hypothetical protein